MPGNGDVLSIACGPLSGIVSAHFWNATTDKDAVETSLYHHTANQSVPRLMAFDWSGGSSVKAEWKLRGGAAPPVQDEGSAQQAQEQHWYKYIVPRLGPNTAQLLPESIRRDSGDRCSAAGEGVRVWKEYREVLSEPATDALRYYFEGMDQCQGVKLLVDADGLYSGVALSLVEEIRDGHGAKVPVFSVPLFSDEDGDVLNRCIAYSLLADASSACVPVDFSPASNLADEAVHPAAALSALFSGCCEGDSGFSLHAVSSTLRGNASMKVSTLQSRMPFPLSMASRYPDVVHPFSSEADLNGYAGYRFLSHPWPADPENPARPWVAVSETHVVGQVFACQGFSAFPQGSLSRFWGDTFCTPTRVLTRVCRSDYLLSSTFPVHLLPNTLNMLGWEDPGAEAPSAEPPRSVPNVAHYTTTCATAPVLHGCLTALEALDLRVRGDQYFELDVWKEIREDLAAMVDEYDQGLLAPTSV